MYFVITTFGCKANQYESDGLAELMGLNGFTPAGSLDNSDVYIVNSCTVTENSDRKVRRALARAKKENPNVITVLCGCFSQASPDRAACMADITVGVHDRTSIPYKVLERLSAQTSKAVDPPRDLPFSQQLNRTRAFLKIEDGCNRDCAYCVIPKARGRVKSRPVAEITEEARLLARTHKEIVLTGINLCAYGADSGSSLCDAVEAVCGVDGLERVRLSSLEPDLITKADIKRLSLLPELCPHFHLSLQSGCDAVLRRMKRRYTAADYFETARFIREVFGKCALTTDIIVGFPGETEDEFAQTMAFAQRIGFAKVHVFAFSKREGTAAFNMEGQVSKQVKRERVARLRGLADEMAAEYFKKQVGEVCEVLVEKCVDGVCEGRARDYTTVRIRGEFAKNEIVKTTFLLSD